jgi:hypothetical protein
MYFLYIKINEINKNTEFFLNDVSGYKKFLQTINSLLGDFKRSKQDFFQEWCEITLSNISDQNTNIR